MIVYSPKKEFSSKEEFVRTSTIRLLKVRFWLGGILVFLSLPLISYFFENGSFEKTGPLAVILSVLVLAMMAFSGVYFLFESVTSWNRSILFDENQIIVEHPHEPILKILKPDIISWSKGEKSLTLMAQINGKKKFFYFLFNQDVPEELIALIKKSYDVSQFKYRGF